MDGWHVASVLPILQHIRSLVVDERGSQNQHDNGPLKQMTAGEGSGQGLGSAVELELSWLALGARHFP